MATTGFGNRMDESLEMGFDWLMRHILANLNELKTRVDYDVQMQRGKESRAKRERSEKVRQKRETD